MLANKEAIYEKMLRECIEVAEDFHDGDLRFEDWPAEDREKTIRWAKRRADEIWEAWEYQIAHFPSHNSDGSYDGATVVDVMVSEVGKDDEGKPAIQMGFFHGNPGCKYINTISVQAAMELSNEFDRVLRDVE